MRRLTLDKRMELLAAYRCLRQMRALGTDLTPRAVLAYWAGYCPRSVGRRGWKRGNANA